MALPQQHNSQADSDWRAHYIIENPADVEVYVTEHPSVAAILAEAPSEIRAVFGTRRRRRLRLKWDPEVGDCWLFLGIPSADVGPSVLPLLDELDLRWWLNRMTKTDATVVINVESL